MGAWDAGSFENDNALDWVWDLAEAEDTSILEDAFSRVTECDDYLKASACCTGIAAAEVVAALRKRPALKLPDKVTAFVARIDSPPSAELVASALAALERINTNSELKELWDESESRDKWYQAIAELESRLK
jgi:Domain of unknown function (DUF4259)